MNPKSNPRGLYLAYKHIADQYVAKFCRKHDLVFEYWVGGAVGEIGSFGDYYIGFNDLRMDIDNRVNKAHFMKWYDESLYVSLAGGNAINYQSYLMNQGIRIKREK